ncbi:MAG: zinc ribbon domain-containing protein, partial [Candidatus Riflebacteria bacterium]
MKSEIFSDYNFERRLEENKLMGSACSNCERKFVPPRAICPQCFNKDLDWLE